MSLLSPSFTAQLNTKFRAALDDQRIAEMELIKVEDRPAPSGYECFTLTFRGPADTPPKQRAYNIDHDQMGSLQIFLVPISQGKDGVIFEAVYNRLLDEQDSTARGAVQD